MSVRVEDRSSPRLLQAANEFLQNHTSRGKFLFSLVHPDVKEGVYHTMWQIYDRPPIPQYGTNRFEDSNGLSSPSILKAEAIYQYLQSNGIQVTIPMEVVEQNAPSLRLAAERFRRGDVREGNHWFFTVHPVVKDGVYYTMWRISNQPNIPNYGRDRFLDINGLSSSNQEKAQAINVYFYSKGIQPFPLRNTGQEDLRIRISLRSAEITRMISEGADIARIRRAIDEQLDDIDEYEDDHPFTTLVTETPFQLVAAECGNCSPGERCAWATFAGATVAGAMSLVMITQLVLRALRPS